MDALGIEIRKDAWAAAHVKSSLFGVRVEKLFLLNGEDPDRRLAELNGYLSDKRLKGARVAVVLPRKSAMTGVVKVPAPGTEALEGVLKFELEKHIPFQPEETLRSFHILKKDRNVFTVFFAAAGREAVDAVARRFTGLSSGPASVVPWQAAVYNALFSSKELQPGKNTAFMWIGEQELRLEVFESMYPAYSRTVLISGQKERWIEEVKKELKYYLTLAGACERRLDECRVIDEDGSASSELVSFLSSELGLPVEPMRLKYGAYPSAAPAVGAALTALGSSSVAIDLGGSSQKGLPAQRRSTLVLGLLAGLLLVTAGVSYPVKDRIASSRLAAAMSGVEDEKKKIEKHDEMLKTMEGRITALEEIEGSSTGLLEVLKELTILLPRGTYLTGFDYNGAGNTGRTVAIEGVSGRASSVLLKMERSERIKAPEFAGPVVKGPEGKERFRIKFLTSGPGK